MSVGFTIQCPKDIHIPMFAKVILLASLLFACASTSYFLTQRDRAAIAISHYSNVDAALRLDPANSSLAKAKGDRFLEQTGLPGVNAAAKQYRTALRNTPCDFGHWLDWGDVSLRLGRTETAEKAFETAEFLAPNNHLVQMAIGDFLLAENRSGEAADHHRRAIELRPSLAPKIFPVYWNISWTASETARRLLPSKPELLSRYWILCLSWIDPDEAHEVWKHLKTTHGDVFEKRAYREYFDFLIKNRKFSNAQALWREISLKYYNASIEDISHPSGLFWNGDFNQRPVFNGGLEWRISKTLPVGAHAEILSGKPVREDNSLWVRFDGKENTSFWHVRKFFFVEPGNTYRLEYRVLSLDITTDNGPYVRIRIYSDPPREITGKVVTNTGEWICEEEFLAPESAYWADVAICRKKSSKLNNRIRGDVWYRDFTLELIGGSPAPTDGTP